jgi:hypothetical protein
VTDHTQIVEVLPAKWKELSEICPSFSGAAVHQALWRKYAGILVHGLRNVIDVADPHF